MEDWALTKNDWAKINQLYYNQPEFPRIPEDPAYMDGLLEIFNHLNSLYPTKVDDIAEDQLLLPFATLLLLRSAHQISVDSMLLHLTALGMLYLTRDVTFEELGTKEWTEEEVQEAMSRNPGLVNQGFWLTEVIGFFAYSVVQSTDGAEARE